MNNYAFNFFIRFIFFWIIGSFVFQKDMIETIFLAAFMAAGFLLLEKFLGSADIKKQDKKLTQLIAGNVKTKRDKLAWIAVMFIQAIGFLFVTAGILGMLFGEQSWTFAIGAIISLASFFFMPALAKRYSKK